MSTDVEFVRLRPEDLTPELAARWRALSDPPNEYHLCHTYEWYDANQKDGASTKWTAFGAKRGEEWVGFFCASVSESSLKFTVAEKPIFEIPLKLSTLRFPGFPFEQDHDLCAAAVAKIFATFPEIAGVNIHALPVESPYYQRLYGKVIGGPKRYLHFAPFKRRVRHLVADESLIDQYDQRFSSKSRNTLKRKTKKFAATHGSMEVREFRRADEVEQFLNDAYEVTIRSWQGKAFGPRVRKEQLAFFQALADAGIFLSYILYGGDKPIAFILGTRRGSTFYYDDVGFDQDHADESPGSVLLFDVLTRLYTTEYGIKKIDFEFGEAPYKAQFATNEYEEVDYFLYRRTLKMRLLLLTLAVYRKVVDGIVFVLEKTNLKARVKKLIRAA
ncbi:MAG: GNAT family N-acetyltransferase [Deltaproteobacteria bacterium]|nr:GNAT family N-acetyltransferase [bacterium]MCB9479560.1 GNAT family N-acetyltransferase [Deltaproteobacteria bacterium]MCB9488410.1 GNAT family N-acetyltransferase [Deltaproteobacteria bacterium]